jgi:hypothetical protein
MMSQWLRLLFLAISLCVSAQVGLGILVDVMDGVEVAHGPLFGPIALRPAYAHRALRFRRHLAAQAPGSLPLTVFAYELQRGQPSRIFLHGSVDLVALAVKSLGVQQTWGSQEFWIAVMSDRQAKRHDLVWRMQNIRVFPAPVEIDFASSKSWTPIARLQIDREHVERGRRLVCSSSYAIRMLDSMVEMFKRGQLHCLTTPMNAAEMLKVQIPAEHADQGAVDPHSNADPTLVSANLVRRTTVPSKSTFSDHEFMFDTIAHALQLQWMAKNCKISLPGLCTHVWNLTLQPRCAALLNEALSSKTLLLPSVSTLFRAARRLDVLITLWYRHEMLTVSSHRYIIPDSSPQAGWNFLCVIEDRIYWPSSMSLEDQVRFDLSEHSQQRILPLSTLGLGASGAEHKAWNIHHMLMMESGSRILQRRFEFRCICSDQGAEAAIADTANIDTGALADLLRRLETGELRSHELDAAEVGYLFPWAVYMPDHCHMIFGGLKEACSGTDQWPPLEGALRDMATFLNRRILKDRFIDVCLPANVRVMFKAQAFGYVDWKWEYMHKFLDRVRPLLPLLIQYFDADAIPRANAKDSAKDIKVLHKCRDALRLPNLIGLVEVAYVITASCDRIGTWFEGLEFGMVRPSLSIRTQSFPIASQQLVVHHVCVLFALRLHVHPTHVSRSDPCFANVKHLTFWRQHVSLYAIMQRLLATVRTLGPVVGQALDLCLNVCRSHHS